MNADLQKLLPSGAYFVGTQVNADNECNFMFAGLTQHRAAAVANFFISALHAAGVFIEPRQGQEWTLELEKDADTHLPYGWLRIGFHPSSWSAAMQAALAIDSHLSFGMGEKELRPASAGRLALPRQALC